MISTLGFSKAEEWTDSLAGKQRKNKNKQFPQEQDKGIFASSKQHYAEIWRYSPIAISEH